MKRFVNPLLIALGAVAVYPYSALAQTQAAAMPSASKKISACSLASKEEVKKHLPWVDVLDSMPLEEEALGASGSACNYPSVYIQVMPYSAKTIEFARKQPAVETISGVGDEAYFRNNADRYAELYVKAGERLITLQANVDSTVDSVKPSVVNLAKTLVKKVR